MTDKHNEEGKDKKLKLPSKMIIGKHVDSKKFKTSYFTSHNNSITVEIKGGRKFSSSSSLPHKINTQISTIDEFNEKISLLKKAASFAKSEEYRSNVTNFTPTVEVTEQQTKAETSTNINSEQTIKNNSHQSSSNTIETTQEQKQNDDLSLNITPVEAITQPAERF